MTTEMTKQSGHRENETTEAKGEERREGKQRIQEQTCGGTESRLVVGAEAGIQVDIEGHIEVGL